MDICILRHGIAAERDHRKFPDDGLRPLTPEGKRKLRKIASFLKGRGYGFDLVLSSPLVRARQTAEITAAVMGLEDCLGETPHLAPSGDPRELVSEISEQGAERVLLVGHEPYLSGLISMLVSGRQGSGINLKKGGFCHLSADKLGYGPCAVLESLLTPRQMVG